VSGTAPQVPAGRRSRDDVVRAAARLFAERGYHGTSMRDLGDTLGLVGSSLYAHIGSKNELLEEIVSNGVQLCLDLAERVLGSGDPPLEKLRALVVGHAGLVGANIESWAAFAIEYRFLPDDQRERVVQLRDRYQGAYRSVLKDGVADGTFREDLDDRLVATTLLSLLNAMSGWYRSDGELPAEALGERIFDVVSRGIGA
jgi:TetR/AcrR family transcriptional regulator, cholesterol catabolism regulator